MLKTHINAMEEKLLAEARIPASSGHPLHKGTPREAFVRIFLQSHLSERVAVGTGEIIDANSKPGEQRSQVDIVIYKRDYPRLDLGGGIHAFLAESVVATIEVKSVLDKEGLCQAVRAGKAIKALDRNVVRSIIAGYQPPSILSYVVAYDGPASMKTVFSWFSEVHAAEGITHPILPVANDERQRVSSASLDGVFVLGRGFIQFGNAPVGFFQSRFIDQHPGARWLVADAPRGSLLLLYVLLTVAASTMAVESLNPMPYLESFLIHRCLIGD